MARSIPQFVFCTYPRKQKTLTTNMAKLLAAVVGLLALATVALAQGNLPDCPPPSGLGNVTFFPNEEDCHLYWMCDNGDLINGTCGDDLVWNPDLNACDWDFNVDNNPCTELRSARSIRRVPSFKRPKPLAPSPKRKAPAAYKFANKYYSAAKKQVAARRPPAYKFANKYESSRRTVAMKLNPVNRPAHRPISMKGSPPIHPAIPLVRPVNKKQIQRPLTKQLPRTKKETLVIRH